MSATDDKPIDDVENFDFGVKKKKKKKPAPDFDAATPVAADSSSAAADDEPASSATTAAAPADGGEDADIFANLKKKKKSKVTIVEGDAEGNDESAAEPSSESFDFGEKKKKKKSKKTDLADFEAALKNDQGEDEAVEEAPESSASKEGADDWAGSNRDYTYSELLHRVFTVLRQNNPELGGDRKRYTIAPPQVMRDGTKKSVFANVVDICKRMHRQPDHVIQFLFAELGTTGSIDASQRLIIKGRFQQKQIENVLKRYIMEYVSCKTCKSSETILTKENRLFFLQCESCGSTRTVSAIKTGFQAVTRDARKAAKAKAG
ncbi:hypothetical protein HDU87_006144 [Geranomyces variabilis]|uniref:Translation initiation factor IF2/IF5 domain-containing protein n=1 Tax=Geranomyces variabilis TaxID=109894 RepID=A0AAD5XKM8_9FUNG|nr:hypothetical protein HDU87_006144 [Geranomyces variabilis]